MVPSSDKNADSYFYRYFYYYNDENSIGTVCYYPSYHYSIMSVIIDLFLWMCQLVLLLFLQIQMLIIFIILFLMSLLMVDVIFLIHHRCFCEIEYSRSYVKEHY